MIFFLVVPVLLAIFLAWWSWVNQPVCFYSVSKKECPEQSLIIEKGQGVSQIALDLERAGLIRNSLAFKMEIFRLGYVKKIQAGEYYISPAEDLSAVIQILTRGSFDKKITVIEGWRSEQVFDYLSKNGFDVDFSEWKNLILKQELEGRLFPDTYMVPKTVTTSQILELMTENFEKKFTRELEKEALAKGIDKQSVLILASIIEREASHPEDRPRIAGILLKRLENNWPLQVDATVQYALASLKCQSPDCDWWPRGLTKENLALNSPYNTYLYRGLPPGPICNPGLSSIRAVIYSQDSPYWFYLSDSEGTIHYATTDVEQAENINKYLHYNY